MTRLKIDHVWFATDRARIYRDSTVEKALRLLSDPDKKTRLSQLECPSCFYLSVGRVAGQAFTQWSCLACGEEGTHPNTGTPKLCRSCAEKFHLCVDCCADLDLQLRSKLHRKR